MDQKSSLAAHSTIAARSSLCLLAGVAYAAEMVAGDADAATRLWCDRARYACSELVAQVGVMVVANEIDGAEAVGSALQSEAKRLDDLSCSEAEVVLTTLLEALASAIEPRRLSVNALLVAACAVHALGAAHELAATWYAEPADAADAAVQAEPVWLEAAASEPDATARSLGALFGNRRSLNALIACNTVAEAGALAHLWSIARWLAARGEIERLVDGINPGDVPRTGIH